MDEQVQRLRAGRRAAELYYECFAEFMRRQGLDPESFDLVIGPEYRNGGAQVAVKSARLRAAVMERMAAAGPLEVQGIRGGFAPDAAMSVQPSRPPAADERLMSVEPEPQPA
jgi:hypothetical protein